MFTLTTLVVIYRFCSRASWLWPVWAEMAKAYRLAHAQHPYTNFSDIGSILHLQGAVKDTSPLMPGTEQSAGNTEAML